MSEQKRIVVLGGGYGGVQAAKILHKKFKKNKDITITLIDKNPYQTLMTELHEVAGARVDKDSVQVSLRRIFAGKRVEVIVDRIRTIDFDAQKLISDENQYPYDYLIIGAGGEPEFFGIPGIKEHSFTLWSLEDALAIREHVETTFRAASREPNAEKRKELLTFVIAGAGFTGIELAGELLEWKERLAVEHGIDETEVNIIVVEALGEILPILPEKMRKKAEKYLTKHGVQLMLNSPIIGAEEGLVKIKDGKELRTKTFIWTCGIMGCEFAGNLQLTKGKCSNKLCQHARENGTCSKPVCEFAKGHRYVDGKRGRLLVNEFMQSVDRQNVYVVGDVTWYREPGKAIIPQIVETALQTAEYAAHNLAADIEGKEMKPFKSEYHGFMVSIGGRYGVAHVMNMSMSGIFAMFMKHFVNVHYLWGLAGLNAVWNYLRHEFFEMKDHRTFIRGLASWKVPFYWTFPLRIFLGVKWFIEGLNKILDGWLNPANIHILPAANGVSAASGAAEAATAASAAVEQAVDTAAAASSAAQAAVDATSAGTQVVQAAADAISTASGTGTTAWAQPLIPEPTGLYQWIADNILSIAPFFFQAVVVLAEVGIGLALIGGLFTFLASGASIILGLMFILSAMAGPEILWYIFAALVMMGGAGRALGLDHWVMPIIKKWWNGTGIAKKTYLYLGEPRNLKKKNK